MNLYPESKPCDLRKRKAGKKRGSSGWVGVARDGPALEPEIIGEVAGGVRLSESGRKKRLVSRSEEARGGGESREQRRKNTTHNTQHTTQHSTTVESLRGKRPVFFL